MVDRRLSRTYIMGGGNMDSEKSWKTAYFELEAEYKAVKASLYEQLASSEERIDELEAILNEIDAFIDEHGLL